MALFGYYEGKPSEKSREKEKAEKPLKTDDWIEKNQLRVLASQTAKDTAFDLFDIYKSAHGMPSYV